MSSSCACLTDRGSEFCGNAERHEYELYRCISRSRTSITRRFHGTPLNEFYRVAFRKRYIVQSTSLQAVTAPTMLLSAAQRSHACSGQSGSRPRHGKAAWSTRDA
jgi:hypothetical protein